MLNVCTIPYNSKSRVVKLKNSELLKYQANCMVSYYMYFSLQKVIVVVQLNRWLTRKLQTIVGLLGRLSTYHSSSMSFRCIPMHWLHAFPSALIPTSRKNRRLFCLLVPVWLTVYQGIEYFEACYIGCLPLSIEKARKLSMNPSSLLVTLCLWITWTNPVICL